MTEQWNETGEAMGGADRGAAVKGVKATEGKQEDNGIRKEDQEETDRIIMVLVCSQE